MTAILLEFRLFAPNAPLYDVNRVFIERFDVSLVTLPEEPPDWLAYELEMVEDERAFDNRLQLRRNDPDSQNDTSKETDQERSLEQDPFHYYTKGRVPLVSKCVASEQLLIKVVNDDD
jgi:hypothetical protein